MNANTKTETSTPSDHLRDLTAAHGPLSVAAALLAALTRTPRRRQPQHAPEHLHDDVDPPEFLRETPAHLRPQGIGNPLFRL